MLVDLVPYAESSHRQLRLVGCVRSMLLQTAVPSDSDPKDAADAMGMSGDVFPSVEEDAVETLEAWAEEQEEEWEQNHFGRVEMGYEVGEDSLVPPEHFVPSWEQKGDSE